MDECIFTPDRAAIINANTQFVHAFMKRNAHAVSKCYTKESLLVPAAHSSLISGQLAIGAFWQGVLDMGLRCTERRTLDIQGDATFRHEIGAYMLRKSNGQPADHGIYIALWQWTESRWLIQCEVWRGSQLTWVDGEVKRSELK